MVASNVMKEPTSLNNYAILACQCVQLVQMELLVPIANPDILLIQMQLSRHASLAHQIVILVYLELVIQGQLLVASLAIWVIIQLIWYLLCPTVYLVATNANIAL